MKYRGKPIFVDAIQLTHALPSLWKCVAFVGPASASVSHNGRASHCLLIAAPDGVLRIDVGDFIVRDDKGVLRRFSESDFNAAYEIVRNRNFPSDCEDYSACRARWRIESQ